MPASHLSNHLSSAWVLLAHFEWTAFQYPLPASHLGNHLSSAWIFLAYSEGTAFNTLGQEVRLLPTSFYNQTNKKEKTKMSLCIQ